MEMLYEHIQQFWNKRATLGDKAGTNDFMLKNLELKLLLETIPSESTILDVGCGNGIALLQLAQEKGCSGVGIDFAENLIQEAVASSKAQGLEKKLNFYVTHIPEIERKLGVFDYVLTERCLINLTSEALQHKAFLEIMSHVKIGGYYLMIESFLQGLDQINELRKTLELVPIDPPWHNLFLDEEHVQQWATNQFRVEEVIPFSSTYYFISRVVYARFAQDKGEELRYDSELNQIACNLPIIGNFGPARMWVWKRIY